MEKFEQYKLDLSKKEQELVTKYLDKISNFIKKHEIDEELYQDIEEMVFEKLSKEKKVDQLKIIKILKEVGEPEVIFSDYINDDDKKTTKEENKELFFLKLIKNGWIRDNKNAWVLGISDTLANKIGIPVTFMRIILVLLIFAGGVSIWLYIIAGIIMPLKGKDYSEMDTYKYFKYQIVKAIKDGAYNLSATFLLIIKYITTKFGKTIKFIVINILPVFRFIIFGTFSIALFSILFCLITIGAMYYTSFSVENIDFVSVLPNFFIFGIISGIIALSIISISTFIFAISGKSISKFIQSIGGIALLFSIFFGLSTGFDLVEKYTSKNENIQIAELNLGENGSGHLDIDLLNSFNNTIVTEDFGINRIKLETTTGSILKVSLKNTIYGNDEISKKIIDGLSNIVLKNENNNIILSSENNKLFNKKVPFSVIERDIILTIPEGYDFTFKNSYRSHIENAFLDKKYEKYNGITNSNCNNSKIYFSKEENKFVCDLNEEELSNVKKQYLQEYVIKNFDSISPLKHKKKYKREYNNDYGYNSDWDFYDFKFEENNNLNFNFQDRSMEINASLNIEDTASGVIVKNFIIEDVEIFGEELEKKYYEDISSIIEYID